MNSNSPSSVGRVQQFVRSHLIGTTTFAIASTLLLTGVSAWQFWKMHQGFDSAITQQLEVEKSSPRLSRDQSQMLASLEKLIQEKIISDRQELVVSGSVSMAILPLLMGSWILILSAVRGEIADRQKKQAELQSSQEQLRATHEVLKMEVAQHQQEQERVQKEHVLLQQDISDLLHAMDEIKAGNLTTMAPASIRIIGFGDTLNRLTEELAQVIGQFGLAAQQVASNSISQKNIATTVACNTGKQSRSVESVLALTKEIRTAVKEASQHLLETNQSLLTLQDTVTGRQQSIQNLDRGIDVLQDGSDRIVQQLKTLGEFVGLADRFVQDQSEISIQTQILALNASLVAARAAEQRDPQKFAAVAREFESIADQVSQLAQQTNDGLAELEQRSSQINVVVTAVDAEVQQLGVFVQDFAQGVKETNTVFEVVQQVTQQAMQSGEIVARTNQQIMDATDLTVVNVDCIAQLSDQIATEAQDAEQVGNQMSVVSEKLLDSIRAFALPERPLLFTEMPERKAVATQV